MCLSSRMTRKAQKEAVGKLPEWVTVWKVLYTFDGKDSAYFAAEFQAERYTGGIYVADETLRLNRKGGRQRYNSGFHGFATRKGAIAWGTWGSLRIVPCRIKKRWITSIGNQDGYKCYVTSKIKIPSPKQYFKTHK